MQWWHAAGTLLQVKLVTLPFSRDVEMDNRQLQRLNRQMRACTSTRAFVCVSREHRMSLELKAQACSRLFYDCVSNPCFLMGLAAVSCSSFLHAAVCHGLRCLVSSQPGCRSLADCQSSQIVTLCSCRRCSAAETPSSMRSSTICCACQAGIYSMNAISCCHISSSWCMPGALRHTSPALRPGCR